MDTRLDDTQQELVASATAVLEKHAPIESIDAVSTSDVGYDEQLYGLFVQLGWTFLGWETGEESTLLELGLVVERIGYFGVPTPFRTTMSAAYLAAIVSDGSADVLEKIGEGQCAAVVDLTTGDPTGRRLVEWADAAATLLVVSRDADSIVVTEVQRTEVTIAPAEVFDAERSGDVAVPANVGTMVGRIDAEAWDRWRAIDRLLRSADILGALRRSMDMTVENAKTRQQFGRAIGTFQALQHQAANMRMDAEALALLTWSALWRAATGKPVVRQSLMAAWQASEAGQRTSKTAVQLHGGIGFIKEYPLHHFYRRTKAQRLRFGTHRALLRELGDTVAAAAAGGDFRAEFVDWPDS